MNKQQKRELLEAYEDWRAQSLLNNAHNRHERINAFLQTLPDESDGWVSKITEAANKQIKFLRESDHKLFPTMIIRAEAIEDFVKSIFTLSTVPFEMKPYKTETMETIMSHKMITEYSEVFLETGLSPRQLAEQREELLEALKTCEPFMHDLDAENWSDPKAGVFQDMELQQAYQKLQAAISNATKHLTK